MTDHNDTLKERLDHLEELADTMRETKKFHTLEEQVADMKRRGINPAESYRDWSDDEGTEK